MQQNTKIENPLPDFFTTPRTPSKEFENDCASMSGTKQTTALVRTIDEQ